MSSDLYVFDGSSSSYCFYHHSSPEIGSSDINNTNLPFFPDDFFHFCDSPIDILETITDDSNQNQNQNPFEESSSFDQFASSFLSSSSPPSNKFENLSLYKTTTQLQYEPNGSNAANGYDLSDLEVKLEESQMGVYDFTSNHTFMPHSYSGAENVAKHMQRSFSSNYFNPKPEVSFQPQFNTLMESQNFHNHTLNSPENSFFTGQIRRSCSTGDLQSTTRNNHGTHRSFSSPLATESSFMEDANFKVGRYSAEERKEKISKYRAKRTQRNFNKTIKYACRKTLADNRPRIRGRFARNDETGEIPKAACSNPEEDEDEIWFDGLQGEEEVRNGAAVCVNSFSQSYNPYYAYY